GLPVLGGDLIVDSNKAGKTMEVARATRAALKVARLTPAVPRAAAEKQAVRRAKARGGTRSAADSVRTVIWAASGRPVLAYETVVGGLQDDGTPNRLHVITDATTGKKLYEYQAIETGVGNTRYSGQVSLTTTR
ncbi:M4 family metallopeptidase, partial [Streptomyces sp. ECR2.10]